MSSLKSLTDNEAKFLWHIYFLGIGHEGLAAITKNCFNENDGTNHEEQSKLILGRLSEVAKSSVNNLSPRIPLVKLFETNQKMYWTEIAFLAKYYDLSDIANKAKKEMEGISNDNS